MSNKNIIPDFPIIAKTTPEKIEVPDADYQAIYAQMVNEFLGQRVGCETLEDTRKYVEGVLNEAVHGMRFRNGKWEAWGRCPARSAKEIKRLGWREALRKRLRIYHYDIDEGFQGNPHQNTDAETEKKSFFDPDNPFNTKLSPEDMSGIDNFVDETFETFPHLDTVTDRPGVEYLAFLALKIRDTIRSNSAVSDKIVRAYKELTDTLGISGLKRMALQNQASEGTVDELVKIYEQTRATFPEMEEELIREEFELLMQKRDEGSISDATLWAYVRFYKYKFENEEELRKFVYRDPKSEKREAKSEKESAKI